MATWGDGRDGGSARESTGVEMIDLTLSSPEPEARPQFPSQQGPPPPYIKREQQPYAHRHDGVKKEQRQTCIKREQPPHTPYRNAVKTESNTYTNRGRPTGQQTRAVNPQHIALLIDTSSTHALRQVLLNLCQTSPALSGAVARGLAPHSTYAKGLMRRHRAASPASTSSTVEDDRGEDLDAYHHMKQRLGGPSRAHRLDVSGKNTTKLPASAPHPKPRMQNSYQVERSNSDLDSELNVPGAFPRSALKAQMSRTSSYSSPSSSVMRHAPELISQKPARSDYVPFNQSKSFYCSQCCEPIEDEASTCFYHPDSRTNPDDDTQVCTRCERSVHELGCELGFHVRDNDGSKHKQFRFSQSPSKQPRFV